MESKNNQIFLKKMTLVQEKLYPIWKKGRFKSCISNDGFHWRMKGFWRPISISSIESIILYNLVITLKIKKAFEIGTGFGYSSFWIASAIFNQYGKKGWFRSLDNYSEGKLGIKGYDFAIENSKFLGFDKISEYCIGKSPEDVNRVINNHIIDLIFIDGNHHGMQPLIDVKSVLNNIDENSVILFHDVNSRYNVKNAVNFLEDNGWKFLLFPTSCNLGICYRNNEIQIKKAFNFATKKTLLNE